MSCSSLRGQAAYFNPIWEAEANGESKIIEATKRRVRRKREARYLAYAEIEQFREEKEEQFRKKCALLKEEEERQKERIRNNVDEEVAWMKARVKLCKPIVLELLETLVLNINYAIHYNVDIRRWIKGSMKCTAKPPNRRSIDMNSWKAMQQCVSKCQEITLQTLGEKEAFTKM